MMFVQWASPLGTYTVKVWTPNGKSWATNYTGTYIATFDGLTDTKPYYVSIKPVSIQSGNCLPEEFMSGMIYKHATGK